MILHRRVLTSSLLNECLHFDANYDHNTVAKGLWTMVYTPIFFFWQILQSFLDIKDISQPLQRAKFHTDWFKTVENRSDSKSVFDGVQFNESKNPRSLSIIKPKPYFKDKNGSMRPAFL